MNERIRELAEQANKQIRHRICPNTFKPIDDPNGPHIRIEFDKEKFAELLITTLSDKVSRMVTMDKGYIPQDPYSVGWNAAVEYASKELKRYYGVEE